MNNNEYLYQVGVIMQEVKKLKQFRGINGDMDLSDKIRKMNELLTDLCYDWSIGTEVIFRMWGFYVLHADIPAEQKENDWNVTATFLRALGQLRTHSDYVQSSQIFFEELQTVIEHEEINL